MAEAFVRLTDEVRSEYAKTMAHTWTRIEELREKKARDSKRTQESIDQELEEIGRLCRLINDDGQPRDQMDLFAGEGDSRVTEEAAAQALAAVMARQEGCSEKDAQACPIHGTCSCMETPDPACVLHAEGAPHITEPPPQDEPELSEPQIVEAMARECVEEWAKKKITPESVTQRNALVRQAQAAVKMPTHRKKPFAEAVKRLLSDVPTIPAGADASDEPEVDGNVDEAAAEA